MCMYFSFLMFCAFLTMKFYPFRLNVRNILQTSLFYTRLCFYQTRSAWSRDQGSNKNHSHAYNFTPTVTKFCVMWEGLSLPHDTKFGNCRCKIVDSRVFPIWSLIHGSSWSGLIKAGPVELSHVNLMYCLFADDDAFGNRPFAMTIRYQLLELLLCIINHDSA